MAKNPLLNIDFLKELDSYPHKTVYGKIILLNFKEEPVKEIQGQITTGSVNIDGNSAVRRTCSLTMVTNQEKIDNIYWGLHNKFKLEIGLKNNINSEYPDIIWFKQGLYVITGLSESLTVNNHTINISGKDKGCLLNGEIGGAIPATTDFGKIEVYNQKGEMSYEYIPIKEIIKNAVITYGSESIQNIIINDIDNYGLELLRYAIKDENKPLYVIMGADGIAENITFNPIDPNGREIKKFQYGEDVGYRQTDLIYPGDLIASPGEAISSILDKIKNIFSSFEYFYDINGRFIFQKKKDYISTSWNSINVTQEEIFVNPMHLSSKVIYNFEDNGLLLALSRQPQLTNLRNDFAIQGVRKTAEGAEIPIHMRYAICDKPVYYKNWEGIIYTTELYNKNILNKIEVDWREIIYQMALDYLKHNQEDGFFARIKQNNSEFYPSGKTGYEMFYTDIQGFWRQLYDPQFIGKGGESFIGEKKYYYTDTGWNVDVEKNPTLLNFWIDFMSTEGEVGKYSISSIGHRPKAINDSNVNAIFYKEVPEILFYSAVWNNVNKQENNLQDLYNTSGYTSINLPKGYEKFFTISARGKSAQDALDELLYQHLYCIESVTLTSIPIYYLEPNHRIFIRDNNTNTNGQYIINKISVPLNYNGTSSITAQLAPKRLV